MFGGMSHLFELENAVFSVLSMLAYFGGFSACVAHRQLSRWLLLATAGFAGLFVSTAIVQVAGFIGIQSELIVLEFIGAIALQTISNFLIAAGLGLALIEIRKKVALSLEPTHARG